MATTTITKVSGVLFVLDSNVTNPKAYFGATGKYQFATDDSSVTITIGADQYTTTWQNLRVGTSTPTSVSQAKTLLNAIFGT
jgi:hypothetical protein